MDFLFTRSDPLEGLYGLPPEKLMPDPADLRGRTFAQEAFDFIGISNHLTLSKQPHSVAKDNERMKPPATLIGMPGAFLAGMSLVVKKQSSAPRCLAPPTVVGRRRFSGLVQSGNLPPRDAIATDQRSQQAPAHDDLSPPKRGFANCGEVGDETIFVIESINSAQPESPAGVFGIKDELVRWNFQTTQQTGCCCRFGISIKSACRFVKKTAETQSDRIVLLTKPRRRRAP